MIHPDQIIADVGALRATLAVIDDRTATTSIGYLQDELILAADRMEKAACRIRGFFGFDARSASELVNVARDARKSAWDAQENLCNMEIQLRTMGEERDRMLTEIARLRVAALGAAQPRMDDDLTDSMRTCPCEGFRLEHAHGWAWRPLKMRDATQPPPGWIFAFMKIPEYLDRTRVVRTEGGPIRSRAEAWAQYDREHGYAPPPIRRTSADEARAIWSEDDPTGAHAVDYSPCLSPGQPTKEHGSHWGHTPGCSICDEIDRVNEACESEDRTQRGCDGGITPCPVCDSVDWGSVDAGQVSPPLEAIADSPDLASMPEGEVIDASFEPPPTLVVAGGLASHAIDDDLDLICATPPLTQIVGKPLVRALRRATRMWKARGRAQHPDGVLAELADVLEQMMVRDDGTVRLTRDEQDTALRSLRRSVDVFAVPQTFAAEGGEQTNTQPPSVDTPTSRTGDGKGDSATGSTTPASAAGTSGRVTGIVPDPWTIERGEWLHFAFGDWAILLGKGEIVSFADGDERHPYPENDDHPELAALVAKRNREEP